MENSYRFFENRDCRYFPCHEGLDNFNCLFCYCPLYFLDECPGTPVTIESCGKKIRDCSDCVFPHRPENYGRMMEQLRKAIQNRKNVL